MKIIELRAERFKRLSAVDITPEGDLVIISGKNAQGKSSVLDAIWMALGGGAAARDSGTVRPIKDGEKDAMVRLDLGEILVTKRWTKTGQTLTVEGADGERFQSPQGLLDSLIGAMSFDPLAFVRMSPAEQRKTLASVVELDFDPDALDKERGDVYEERTMVNREVKSLEGHLSSMPAPKDSVPEEEVSMSKLLAELQEANEWKAANDAKRREVESAKGLGATLRAEIDRLEDDIERLHKEVGRKSKELSKLLAETLKKDKALEGLVDPDTDALSQRIQEAEQINASVRAAAEYRRVAEDIKLKKELSEALSDRIKELDVEKAKGFARTKFPVAGLAFDVEGITFKGIPFQQCSSAEQTRIAVAIAAALNPKIRVIRISDGSLLDSDSMAEVEKMAVEHDMQIWIERVDESGAVGVVIEDGMVKEG